MAAKPLKHTIPIGINGNHMVAIAIDGYHWLTTVASASSASKVFLRTHALCQYSVLFHTAAQCGVTGYAYSLLTSWDTINFFILLNILMFL